MADQIEVPTPDGRILDALTEGDPAGFPLVYHLGTPGGVVPFPILDRAARSAGLRVLAYARPGYARSTPWPYSERGPRMADDVVDVLALLHHFEVDEFVTLGWSGGGPRALACAAILPGRCRAAATLGSVAPYDADGLDWYAGMGADNVEGFEVAARGATAYHALLRQEEDDDAEPEPRSAEQIIEDLGELLTPTDAAFMTGEFAAYWDGFGRRAREQGVVGMRDDGLALVGDWGFDVTDTAVPVAVWHGRRDGLVPFGHGEWLADRLPNARPHLLEDQGHLTLWGMVDDVLADLQDLAGV